jgi:hypothetical protein
MLGLCQGDRIVDTLRNVFHANIVAIPESRIQPLVIVAAGKGATSFRGRIMPLLRKPTDYTDPTVQTSTMPSVSGTKTRQVSFEMGLEILGNFLQGFGVPSIGLSAAFDGATRVSFSFNKVARFFVDVDELGEHVTGSLLNRDNPSTEIFFNPDNPFKCYILDSAITSQDFTFAVEQSSKQDFKVSVPTISEIVSKANAGVTVSSSSTLAVTFTGDRPLGFAFSCLLATFDATGRIKTLEPGGDIPQLEALRGDEDTTIAHTPDHVLLTRDPLMLIGDFKDFADD